MAPQSRSYLPVLLKWTIRCTWNWVKDLGKILKPCRFSVLAAVIAALAFIVVPQGQDLVRRFGEWDDKNVPQGKILIAFAALLVVAFNSWYFSRLMLYFRFPDSPGHSSRFGNLRTWVPRALGAAPFITMALAFFIASRSCQDLSHKSLSRNLLGLSIGSFMIGVVFFLTVIYRRDLIVYLQKSGLKIPDPFHPAGVEPQLKKLEHIPLGTRAFLCISVALALGLILALGFSAELVAPMLGSITIALLSFATWIPLGSALIYSGHRYRLPIMTLLISGMILFSFWNDNHAIRIVDDYPPQLIAPNLKSHLESWLQTRVQEAPDAQAYPILIVTAEGGGARAAYWTGSVLAALHHEAPDLFRKHLYAISGVSGGSLGAGVFAAQLAEETEPGKMFCEDRKGHWAERPLTECTSLILEQDFLSSALGTMLFPDLFQRFLPFRIPRFDRGRSLEESWESAWRKSTHTNRLAEPFAELWARKANAEPKPIPNLVFNGTWVETGKRILTTNLRFESQSFRDAQDVFGFLGHDVRLSTAIHNSARFPYISPAGRIVNCAGETLAHVVDGGYFENSGSTSAYEILTEVLALKGQPDPGNWKRVQPVVIAITNSPTGTRAVTARKGLIELLGPPTTLFSTRQARGSYAVKALVELAESTQESESTRIKFVQLGTCAGGANKRAGSNTQGEPQKLSEGKFRAPLGWQLSEVARQDMDDQLKLGCKDYPNGENLDKVEGWLRDALKPKEPETPVTQRPVLTGSPPRLPSGPAPQVASYRPPR